MELIHLFVSNLLLDLISKDVHTFRKGKIQVRRDFYDIDTYIVWAEKKLNRLARAHIETLFADDTSLLKYYQIWDRARKNASFVQQVKEELEYIFPFIQRVKNPKDIVFKYFELLETIYDSIGETLEMGKRAYRRGGEGSEIESAAEELDELSEEDAELEVESVSEKVERDSVSETTGVENSLETTGAAAAENAEIAETETFSETTAPQSVPEESETPTFKFNSIEECRRLGIKLRSEEGPEALLKKYYAGAVEEGMFTNAGLKAYIYSKKPGANISTYNRARLIEVFNTLAG